jgi:predicted DCC family thiol-disulfide oxidoreductase YuxK
MSKHDKPSATVWFDSACPICSREIRVMRALDWRHRIAFVDLYGPNVDCPIEPALLLARFHAADSAGKLHSGAAAFALMWQQVPLFWPLGQLARIPAILALMERAYLRFLRWRQRRQRFNRSEAPAPCRETHSS